jgi:hypothetical protein
VRDPTGWLGWACTAQVICDTAGRLHTAYGLMEELAACKKSIGNVLAKQPNEVLLVLDGTTGVGLRARACGGSCSSSGCSCSSSGCSQVASGPRRVLCHPWHRQAVCMPSPINRPGSRPLTLPLPLLNPPPPLPPC